jgi:predicted SnoaL-like aldol condensation-catalyzing enzyme
MKRKSRAVIAVFGAGIALLIAYAMSPQAKTPLDVNKETVTNFYKLAFNDHKPAAAVEKYVGGGYTQHNPMVADGALPFIDFVNGYAAKYPHLHVDIKRVIAEGDLVVTHVLITTSETDRGMAAIDIFRLEEGKIVEHWDVVQPVPDKPANENGMF